VESARLPDGALQRLAERIGKPGEMHARLEGPPGGGQYPSKLHPRWKTFIQSTQLHFSTRPSVLVSPKVKVAESM
jgi:hypothetical protein